MELEQLADSNKARLQALAAKGVVVDPTMLLKLRVDKLTDLILGPGGDTRLAFEEKWEKTISEILDEAEQQLARRILLDGVG